MHLGIFPALNCSDNYTSVHILLPRSVSMVLPGGQRCWELPPLVSPELPVTTLGHAEGRVNRGVHSATPCHRVCQFAPWVSHPRSHPVSTCGAKSEPRYCPQTQVWILASRKSSPNRQVPCDSAMAAATWHVDRNIEAHCPVQKGRHTGLARRSAALENPFRVTCGEPMAP